MNYYNEIKNKLIDNEIYGRVKDYSWERNRVKTYFEIGKLLSEAGSKYGDSIIENYSQRLALLSIKDYGEINYYINLTINQNLSKRELEYKIKSKEYE